MDDGSADTDGGGISNIQEYFNSTNPYNADNDGLGDRWEPQFTGNLSTVNSPTDNPDSDYLNNEQEWQEWRSPLAFDDLLPINGVYKGIILHKQELSQ